MLDVGGVGAILLFGEDADLGGVGGLRALDVNDLAEDLGGHGADDALQAGNVRGHVGGLGGVSRHVIHQLLEGVHRAVIADLLSERIHRVRRGLGSGLLHGFLVHRHKQAVAAHLQQVALVLGHADLDGLEAVLTVP